MGGPGTREDGAGAGPEVTGGPAVTAGTGGGPGPGPGPGPGLGLGTGEIAATAGTGGTPGEVTPGIGDLDLRAAADLANYCAVSCY